MLTNLIQQLNKDYSLALNDNDFSGYLVKKLTNSTTIAINKSGNQYHIDVTDTHGPMKMFPVVISSESLDAYSPANKKDYNLKLQTTIFDANIKDLLANLQSRVTAGSYTLRDTLSNLKSRNASIFSGKVSDDSFTYVTYSKRSAGQHQTEIGTSADGQGFLLLRAVLLPNDYLIFIKRKSQISYTIFGIQQAKFVTDYNPIIGTTLFEEPADDTPVDSSLISSSEPVTLTGLNQIFFGPPGTGKSTVVNNIVKDGIDYRITFHPDTDYNSFVGGYKPTVGEKGSITYEFVPQIFTNAYLRAWENPSEKVYLIIEEINRGNCAQIFGDIFQLLDRRSDGFSDYSITVDADMERFLTAYFNDGSKSAAKKLYLEKMEANYEAKSFSKVALPANLFILATMNTSDQSLFPMDSAFKRRWDWEFIPINYDTAQSMTIKVDETHQYNWGTFIQKINSEILSNTHSEDKQIGNWFVKSSDGIINFNVFRSKVMFYLWTELCKDEYQTDRNLFKINLSDGNTADFTFNDLFTGFHSDSDKIIPGDLLKRFFEYHRIPVA